MYRSIGDHTESFEVDYDPAVLSYDDLLQLFWSSHDPTKRAYSRQYQSVVLARTDEEYVWAQRSCNRLESLLGRPVITRIERLDRFYPAEDYHQKWYLRQDDILAAEFRGMFGADETAFRDSTAAARVNGYAAGSGDQAQLATEITFLGLTEAGRSRLISRVRGSGDGVGCSIG